jgi:Flp pilus assembly protein TadD
MAASGVRHFSDRHDEALDWTDRLFAFNTTCFNCHVTNLSTNYDLPTDTYHTEWSEPGIGCESCHGPGLEHVRVMEAAKDRKVEDIKIIRTKGFTPSQTNDLCATCHSKLVPLSVSFLPGEKFFDHFDLVTLEQPDYYPDGRDLGENYTYTSWLMSPCAKSEKLNCLHCHTSSGRTRFTGETSNQSCLPCHKDLVANPETHGHHASGSKGNDCVGCHMPTTRFAGMNRTDHSMRPPTPATTLAFRSPNACNRCHADHDAAWADDWCRKWYPTDYQAGPLRQAELLDMARKQQWECLPKLLAVLQDGKSDPIYKASLTRALNGCEDERKWPVLLALLHDPSPLVRASAVSGLASHLTAEVVHALLAATADESRLVRIRCASTLASLSPESLADAKDRAHLQRANAEFMAAMQARPDDWATHTNLGNYYMDRGDFSAAAACFERATTIEARQIGPMVNASIAYSSMRRNDKAEASLRHALKVEPENAAANLNLGLLLGEKGDMKQAEQALRTALRSDPRMAAAAYNLGVILGPKNVAEAVVWLRKAHQLRPGDPKYAYTLAYFLRQNGNSDEAIELLRKMIQLPTENGDAYLLLGEIYESQGDHKAVEKLFREALKSKSLTPMIRQNLEEKLHR